MKIKPGFVLRSICNEHIVCAEGLENINFNKLVSLNSSAVFLWEQAEGREFTPETLASLLAGKYGITPEQAQTDATAFCDRLIKEGIAE